MKKKKWTKVALALYACFFVIWWALGTGATLAWFSDTDIVRNQFQVGLLQLAVDYKNDLVNGYENLEGATEAFNDQALYEPGYTQVVYLRLDNLGDTPFKAGASPFICRTICVTALSSVRLRRLCSSR